VSGAELYFFTDRLLCHSLVRSEVNGAFIEAAIEAKHEIEKRNRNPLKINRWLFWKFRLIKPIYWLTINFSYIEFLN